MLPVRGIQCIFDAIHPGADATQESRNNDRMCRPRHAQKMPWQLLVRGIRQNAKRLLKPQAWTTTQDGAHPGRGLSTNSSRAQTCIAKQPYAVSRLKLHDLDRVIDRRPSTAIRQPPVNKKPKRVSRVHAEHKGHTRLFAGKWYRVSCLRSWPHRRQQSTGDVQEVPHSRRILVIA